MTPPQLERLTVEDLSDREFILIVIDFAQADGWTESLDVAKALGFEDRRFAAQRFAWLARYGAMEREYDRDQSGNIRYYRDGRIRHTQRWRPTDVGRVLAAGHLRKGDQSALDRLRPEHMLELTAWMTDRARGADWTTRKLVERQWRYGTSKRRNGSGP
jgi:hypothetical protein